MQPHLLAAGGQDGVLSIWDMRQELYPVTLLEAHAGEGWTPFSYFFPYLVKSLLVLTHNPLTPKISLAILLIVYHTALAMLV